MRGALVLVCAAATAGWLVGCACGPCSPDDGACPEGTHQVGAAPPEGKELYCEKDGAEGVRHGPYTRWHDNGVEAEAGNYKDGQKDGIWKESYEEGQVHFEATYYNDTKDGPYTSYFKDGTPRSEGLYEDDSMEGPWKLYHPNGKLAEEGTYLAGQKDGWWIFSDNLGRKERKIRFAQGVEKQTKKILPGAEDVLPDGAGDAPPVRVDNGNGVDEGPSPTQEAIGRPDERCKDGGEIFGSGPPTGEKLWCEKGGQKHGLWRQWWENGNRWIEGEYTDGLKSGVWTEFYDNGVITSRGQYAGGKKTGTWVFNYANGQVRTQGDYENDNKTGKWVEFHPDGRQKNVEQF